MNKAVIPALSIAGPLVAMLAARPFNGRVLGVFNRACNLIDARRRVVALVLPEIGNGPFAITVPGTAGLFDALTPGQPARGDTRELHIGSLTVSLGHAKTWSPRLPIPGSPLNVSLMVDLLEPYLNWPGFDEDAPLAREMAASARKAAAQLSQGLTQAQLEEEAVARLAGLGNGLTPAGDDFLLGAMAALWLTGHAGQPPRIADIAAPRTGALSSAFLVAASRGEFIEPWHALARMWETQKPAAIIKAIQQVADFGASSGRDALAGFGHTLLAIRHRLVTIYK